MEPTVSIIIPIYNAEKTLEQCLVSCLRQSLASCEILLVDDGSTDRSLSIANTYASRFPDRIRVFSQTNCGPSCARNLGLSHAKGKFIGFLDADDRADRDMFLRLVLAAETRDADLVVCGRYDIVQDTHSTQSFKRVPHSHYPCSSIYETPELLCDTTQFVWDKLFLRALIETHQLRFDERFRYTEDVLFLCTYKSFCKRIFIIPDTLYYHYMDERNPATKYGSSLLDVPKVLQEIYQLYYHKLSFSYPDVLFDLAAKRFLFRLKRFPYMGSKLLQWKFCRAMYRVMKQYFPDWRKRIVTYHRAGFPSGFFCIHRGSLFLMSLYIFLPNRIKQFFLRLSTGFPAAIRHLRRRFTGWKKYFSQYTSLLLNAYYRFFLDHKKSDTNLVLIQAKGGRVPGGNMFFLLLETLRHNKKVVLPLRKEEQPHWKQYCTTYNIPTSLILTVKPESYRYYRLLASCAYLLNDSTFPQRFQKKSDQLYLNTWHGVPLKHMGCDVPQRAYAIGDVQRNFLHADYLLFPNPFMQQTMMRSYMLDQLYSGTILQESYPRVTILNDKNRRSLLRKHLGIADKKVCCYLPTWRGLMTKKQNARQHNDCMRYLSQLDNMLDADTLLYVKLHPYAEKGFQLGAFQHIRPFPPQYETYDFLTSCDMLITDYSSVLFDFAVTGRKIILFAYDYAEYKASRGLYLDPATFPFPLVQTAEELAEEIRLPKTYDDTDFRNVYCPYSTAGSVENLCRFLYHNEAVCRTITPSVVPPHLYYAALLTPGSKQFYLEYLLQQEQKANQHYLSCIRGSELKEHPERIRKLLTMSPFFSMDTRMFFTPVEALFYLLVVKKGCSSGFIVFVSKHYLNRLFLREYHRKFAHTVFRGIVFCCENDNRHLHMFAAVQCPLSIVNFSERTTKS